MADDLNYTTTILAGDAGREPDAHGQAAFLLVESLIHGLIERGVITGATAIDVIETAVDVKIDVADAMHDSPATMRQSLAMLENMAKSLQTDQPQ